MDKDPPKLGVKPEERGTIGTDKESTNRNANIKVGTRVKSGKHLESHR